MKHFIYLLSFLSSSLFAQGLQGFYSGYYYDLNGEKIVGTISHQYQSHFGDGPDNIIFFKGADGKKIKLTTQDITSFVWQKDSFIIIKNFRTGKYAEFTEDFVKVMVIGKVTLYCHYSTSGAGDNVVDTRVYLGLKDDEIMPILDAVADDEDIAARIKNSKGDEDIIKSAVIEYNSK